MCPLRVLLLWALLCLVRGNSTEEIFTRTGFDLLLPIRHNLNLNGAGGQSCDEISWNYALLLLPIVTHKYCNLSESKHSPNVRISENGSLIIHNVTPENDGIYTLRTLQSPGHGIQIDHYIVHVEGKTWEEIFTRPGSDFLLPIRHNLTLIHTDRRRCDEIQWKYRKSSTHNAILILRHRNCTPIVYNDRISPNVRISENGSLIIHNVTPENDGMYGVIIHNSNGDVIQRDHYIIHVEVPVSDPILNVRCLQNGSAEISCRADNGTNTSIYLTVSDTIYNIPSSERTVRVTVPLVSPPHYWNISCSVMNNISNGSTNQTYATCPAPLSAPSVNFSCLNDGRASVSCVLEKDRDVTYTWTLNGKLWHREHSPNITLTIEELRTGPINVSCAVNTSVSRKESNNIQIYCPGLGSCLTCLLKSLTGGSVALLVKIPPLFIAHWYIIRGMDKKS
ncbi:T-cell surface antigen CD2 isoform X4 [Pyxicephalus adspersus]|uniref:T-cell surface antigen CD2 isoform X4 n=1 Tax=Pyxicephalus adspersus TaxID=30357 RepID=UPI003B5AF1B4